jgi:hypothetical protein
LAGAPLAQAHQDATAETTGGIKMMEVFIEIFGGPLIFIAILIPVFVIGIFSENKFWAAVSRILLWATAGILGMAILNLYHLVTTKDPLPELEAAWGFLFMWMIGPFIGVIFGAITRFTISMLVTILIESDKISKIIAVSLEFIIAVVGGGMFLMH